MRIIFEIGISPQGKNHIKRLKSGDIFKIHKGETYHPPNELKFKIQTDEKGISSITRETR